jgi:hypothetical protein
LWSGPDHLNSTWQCHLCHTWILNDWNHICHSCLNRHIGWRIKLIGKPFLALELDFARNLSGIVSGNCSASIVILFRVLTSLSYLSVHQMEVSWSMMTFEDFIRYAWILMLKMIWKSTIIPFLHFFFVRSSACFKLQTSCNYFYQPKIHSCCDDLTESSPSMHTAYFIYSWWTIRDSSSHYFANLQIVIIYFSCQNFNTVSW